MGKCGCGFTTDPEGMCNGTHKIVKAVRESIATEIALTALPTHPDQLEDSRKMFVFVRDWTEKIARGQ